MKIEGLAQDELITSSLSCAGCSSILALRLALKALGGNTVVIAPAGCMSTVNCYWPQIPCRVPFFVSPFAATGAILQGVSAGFSHRNRKDVRVIAIAGDGGTADIGMSSFSQAITSGYKFIYICVDNQGYMNTGIQWSSTTPPGAITTTTPIPETTYGNIGKDLFKIALAHGIPYAATATPAYPYDYLEKVRKAANVDGPSFIHVLTPCPPGWGFSIERTIEIGCLAVECGMWYLCEYQAGEMRFTHQPKERKPISEYLATQSRFRRMKPKDEACLQKIVDERMDELEAMARTPGRKNL